MLRKNFFTSDYQEYGDGVTGSAFSPMHQTLNSAPIFYLYPP